MRAKQWQKIINSTSDLNKDWLSYKREEIGLGESTWYYDQWITTHGILRNKICNVPPWSGLWNNKDLVFDPQFNDSEQCWHGQGYKDCNLNIHIVAHGCKWYHFFPWQKFEDHVEKFNEITNNAYNIETVDIFHQKI